MISHSILRFKSLAQFTLPLLWAALSTSLAPQSALGGPTIVAATPANGAMGVAPSAPVVITFSTAMNTNLTKAQFFNLLPPQSQFITSATWSADGTKLTCTPTPPFPTQATVIWNVQGKDAAGNALTGAAGGIFTTGSGGPSIASVVPANLASDVPTTTPVVFGFSVPMNTNSTWAQFHDSDAPLVALPVVAAWSDDKTTLTCTPNPPFPAGKTIMWNVTGEDTAGNQLPGGSGMFTTTAATATLVATAPPDAATDVPPSAPIAFTFSAAMNTTLTVAQFYDSAAPLVSLPTTPSWNVDQTQLTCTPTPSFPTSKTILWIVSGIDTFGNSLPTNSGSFVTASSDHPGPPTPGLISRGELVEQVDTDLLQTLGPEFMALADAALTNGVTITTPAPGRTNVLQDTGWPELVEIRDAFDSPEEFSTNYPPGDYIFTAFAPIDSTSATLSLADGALPSAPRILNWQSVPYVVLGQSYPLTWDFAPGGAAVDHVQLAVDEDSAAIFATPLPDAVGALTGASNTFVVPAAAFPKAGLAEVRLTAFSFTGTDTDSIAGVTVRAARHRTTTFPLRVVDGSQPPPVLLTTNLSGVPTKESFLFPLFTTNGVRPLRFELIEGTLPPGLTLESNGALSGEATSEGAFAGKLRVTDLLGRRSTQSLAIVTVPLTSSAAPRLENARSGPGPELWFEVLASVGAACALERSLDLSHWTTVLTTNVTAERTTLQVPVDNTVAFFRARGPGTPLPTPNPLTVTPILNTNSTASAELGLFGGALSLTNAAGYVMTLHVPPRALDRAEVITMTDVPQIVGLPLSGALQAAVDLKPDGLVFDVPARLDITAPGALNPNTLLGFGALADGSEFALRLSFLTNHTVSLHLPYFSLVGAGDGSAPGAQQQTRYARSGPMPAPQPTPYSPTDPMAAVQQQAAAAQQACLIGNCDADSLRDQLLKLFIQFADQVVLPNLKQAVTTDSDSVLDNALQTWLKWLDQMSLLGLNQDPTGQDETGALQGRLVNAYSLASQALNNGITKGCNRCLEHDLLGIFRVLQLTHWAHWVGWDYTERLMSCASKCLVFELEIESKIQTESDKSKLITGTKAKVKLRPNTTGGADPLLALLGALEGSGQWNVPEIESTSKDDECKFTHTPKAGQLKVPLLQISLCKKREVFVDPLGMFTVYIPEPEMTLYVRSDESLMPSEARVLNCSENPPQDIDNMFPVLFKAFHIKEEITEQALGGSTFKISGFDYNGPNEIVLSKSYEQTAPISRPTTEDTTIRLRHKPRK